MKTFISFLAWVVLNGCTTYHARPLKPAAVITAYEARTLESPDYEITLPRIAMILVRARPASGVSTR